MRELEDEERSHRGEAIGGAGDQCPEERKNQTEMKKNLWCAIRHLRA